MSKEAYGDFELRGRRRIFTDVDEINDSNVIKVLQDAMLIHEQNKSQSSFLLKYEKGFQPLKRDKNIRKDIDVKVCDNVANEVTEFKLGYFWGNPIMFVQRADKDINGNSANEDDKAVSMLNEMLEDEFMPEKDQELGRFVEITGVGYQMVDIKNDYEGGSVFDCVTLNPLYTFVVHDNSPYHRPMMGVTYRTLDNGNTYYTCITKDRRYEIVNQIREVDGKKEKVYGHRKRSGEKNPIGRVPIVEFIRSHDRMGCFERQISEMDNLNILVSDFTNNVSQDTQAIWWGNDWEFPEDPETGEKIKPSSNQWIMTQSGEGKNPKIQPLVIQTQYDGILNDISYRRDTILQKCHVPLRSETGSGSTGTATSMSSGWHDAEVDACRQEQIEKRGKMELLKVILEAIKNSPDTEADSPLLELNVSDVKPKFTRNKTYDMATKANAFATWIAHGIHGRHALQQVDAFPDTNLVWEDSKELIEKYQDSIFNKQTTSDSSPVNDQQEEKKMMSDLSDQTGNSPILDGMNTEDASGESGGDENVQ